MAQTAAMPELRSCPLTFNHAQSAAMNHGATHEEYRLEVRTLLGSDRDPVSTSIGRSIVVEICCLNLLRFVHDVPVRRLAC
jgi:hypothetical protein